MLLLLMLLVLSLDLSFYFLVPFIWRAASCCPRRKSSDTLGPVETRVSKWPHKGQWWLPSGNVCSKVHLSLIPLFTDLPWSQRYKYSNGILELFARRLIRITWERSLPKAVFGQNNIMPNFVISFIQIRHRNQLFFCLGTKHKHTYVHCSFR